MTTNDTEPAQELLCSARGCRDDAAWGLRWNNPRLHSGDRRKVWLACDDHRAHLEQFLGARGFHRDTVPVDELGPGDG
ncbi:MULTISPECIES: hypothetical protein [unclassified Actinotalea]|uniref:hypothetical protein n=1 Tax=unclassified Actinotalea TaxID=2638618 RepID=UPI0015F5244D|nr:MULTISPECIES: hypothetical protein [unclassified Actinotalea]